MKIAMLNLSNNVTDYSTTPSGETLYIKRLLERIGHDVTIITNKSTQFAISFEEVDDINEFDKLIVMNGAINFFGGTKNMTILNNYKLMAHFKKPILYFLTDLRLPFRQMWPKIQARNWGLTEEDCFVSSPITVVSQTRNLDVVEELHKDIDAVKKIIHFPLEKYKLVLEIPNQDHIEKTCDLIYGGSYRAGNREGKMLEYLFDTGLNTVFFGTAKLSQFVFSKFKTPPTFEKKVHMNQFIDKTSTAVASIIIGDKLYNGNHITLRVWETMMSQAVCFIDEDFDPYHSIMGNAFDSFFYVNSKDELVKKINIIKNDNAFRCQLLGHQYIRIYSNFDVFDYLKELEEMIDAN